MVVLCYSVFSACAGADDSKKQKAAPFSQVQKRIGDFSRPIRRFLRCVILADGDSRLFQRIFCIAGSPEKASETEEINPAAGLPAYSVMASAEDAPPAYSERDSHSVVTENPPPAYTPSPEIIREKLRSLNPKLWVRLGLDKLPVLTCNSACQATAHYLVTVDVLKNTLATQSYENPLPALDIELHDISGNGFSLSQLPLQWLQVDEIVENLETISDRNNRSSLRVLADALDHARTINDLIYQEYGKVDEPLRRELETVKSLGIDLNAYRERGQKKDAIAHMVQRGIDCVNLRKCLDSGVCHPEMHHAAETLAECIKGDSRTTQLRVLMQWLALQEMNNSVVPAGYQGSLVDYAIEHNADMPTLSTILSYSGVTLSNLLDIIRMSSDPDSSTSFSLVWRFALTLAEQGHDLAKIKTEHGSLVDYVQAYSSCFLPVQYLYRLGVPATTEQLVRAIRSSPETTFYQQTVNVIVWQLQEQNVSLCSWKNEQQENLADYARRMGAPEAVISTLAQCVSNCAGRAELVELPVFEVTNAEQYLKNIRQLLQDRGYRIASPPADGQCFYHALSAMLGTSSTTLRAKLILFLESLISNYMSGNLTEVQNSIINTVGYDAVQSIFTQLLSDQWGELSYLPVVAAIMDAGLNDGIYVMTPGTGGQDFTITHFISGQHSTVSLEDIPDQTPILIHNGSDHWLYAIHHPVLPSTPVNNTVTDHESIRVNLLEIRHRLQQLQ